MALLTEADVKRMSNGGTRGPVAVDWDDVLTPSARSYLREKGVEVVYPRGRPSDGHQSGQEDRREGTGGGYRTLFGATLSEKPEHMTHLRGNVLVFKDHSRIAFRGWIDLLEAEILLAQLACQQYPKLLEELEEVLAFVRRLIRCDVLGEPVGELKLCGYDAGQLREYSHYPEKHLGQPHFLPSYRDGTAMAAVNRLRTAVRQAELAAYAAFRSPDGAVEREDIIRAMNRLSSLMWILMIKLKAGHYQTGP